MTLDKRLIGTFWSLVIIAVWTGLVFIIAYPSRNAPTDYFGVIIYCIMTLFFGLITGAIFLIIRLLMSIKNKSSFYYNFVGTLNTCLGVLGLTLASLYELDKPWIIAFTISLIIGLFILVDIYGKRNRALNNLK